LVNSAIFLDDDESKVLDKIKLEELITFNLLDILINE